MWKSRRWLTSVGRSATAARVIASSRPLSRSVRPRRHRASLQPPRHRPDQQEILVPFVAAIVPEVDVAGGRLVIDPPGGLLDPSR